MLHKSFNLFESIPLTKAKLVLFGYCSATLFSLIIGPTAFAENQNPVKNCKPKTELVIAMYLVPVNWNPPHKIAHIVSNKYWGAPEPVPAHMTLTGFALPSNSKAAIIKGCKKHNESMTIGVENFNKRIGKPYHVPYSNWGTPRTSKGKHKYVEYPLHCKSRNCFSLLRSALKLNSKFVGFVEDPTTLHVSFDNPASHSHENQEAIRKFLGGVKWKACKVLVTVSGHNSSSTPGKGLVKDKTC